MRDSENSIELNNVEHLAGCIERMQFFYELFPYPDRPFFLKPNPTGSIEAHAGFAQLISQNSTNPCLEDIKLRDVRHAFPDQKRIALVGCGTDEPLLFRALHPHNPIVAIDLSHKSLLRAERKIRWHNFKPVTLIHGDAQTALVHSPKFDHVQCFGVLHHQPNPKDFFKTLSNSLEDSGTLRIMIYSSCGRRLERGIQKKFSSCWESLQNCDELGRARQFLKRLQLNWIACKLVGWRLLLPLMGSRPKSLRFKYVKPSRARIADAFLHPSDHALQLKDILTWSSEFGLKVVFYKAKSYELGTINSLTTPKIPLQTLVDEEERGNISTN
ncbi:MAG: hypothetical protein RJB13_1468, partial [Pseudomonadota bacterium]